MTSLLDLCENYYGSRDLYRVLQIPKSATDKEVRKAYRKLSLIVHPDRVVEEEKAEATEKFKVLGKIHALLSNSEKRKVYDESGDCGDDMDDCVDWFAYWRSLFKKITLSDIKNYEQSYKGSEEELEDLKRAYRDGKGCMDYILEAVPFTETSEEDRLKDRLKPFIESGELPNHKQFFNEAPKKAARRKRKYEKEAKEAEQLARELDLGMDPKSTDGDLGAIIQARQAERALNADMFFERLAEKYAPQKKKVTSARKGKK